MRRAKTPDWDFVGWHYRALHTVGPPFHNRLWVRAKGLEKLPAREGFVYAGNHTSWWDPIVLQLTTPRPVNWLAKKEMMNNRFNRWFFFDKGGCIPVDRNARNPEAFSAAAQALRDGRIIGIFPESTRFVGELGPFKSGAARLAFESGAPIVPVALATDRFWPSGRSLPKLNERVYLNVGEPIHVAGDPADHDATRAATEKLRDAIDGLLREARAARDARADWPSPK